MPHIGRRKTLLTDMWSVVDLTEKKFYKMASEIIKSHKLLIQNWTEISLYTDDVPQDLATLVKYVYLPLNLGGLGIPNLEWSWAFLDVQEAIKDSSLIWDLIREVRLLPDARQEEKGPPVDDRKQECQKLGASNENDLYPQLHTLKPRISGHHLEQFAHSCQRAQNYDRIVAVIDQMLLL
ncbi:hypothetical protein ACJX0J_027626, partial [Zea mays]